MQTGALPALPLDVGGGPLLKVRCFQNVSLIVTFPKNERKIIPTFESFDPKVQSMSILHTFLFIFTGVSLCKNFILSSKCEHNFDNILHVQTPFCF